MLAPGAPRPGTLVSPAHEDNIATDSSENIKEERKPYVKIFGKTWQFIHCCILCNNADACNT